MNANLPRGSGTTIKTLGLAVILRAMRPRQWLKNVLIFLPLVAAHSFAPSQIVRALIAFIAFCFCASSAYVFNDVLDIAHDREHPKKRWRPIAAGLISLRSALALSLVLALAGMGVAAWGGESLLQVAGLYFVLTVLYSLYLKKLLLIDVVVLSSLYTIRLIGGAAATGIQLSFWLLSFSFFLFLSLALLKRHNELLRLRRGPQAAVPGRGYLPQDSLPVGIFGVSAAVISTLVLMLYYNSAGVAKLYPSPLALLFVVPLFFIWIARLWVLSFREVIEEDPLLHVSTDVASLAIVALCILLGVTAST